MLRQLVAILAATLLSLKSHTTTTACTMALPSGQSLFAASQQQRLRRQDGDDDYYYDDNNDEHHRHDNHFYLASDTPHIRRNYSAVEDVLGHYPQTGRFGAKHKSGVLLTSARDPGAGNDKEWEKVEESWTTTLAALAASGTALALRPRPPEEANHHSCASSSSEKLRQQYRTRRRRRGRRPPRPDDAAAAAAAASKQLHTELSSNLQALSSWSRRIRRRASAAKPAAAAAATARRRRRRRSTPYFSTQRASAAAAVAARRQLWRLRAQLSGLTAGACCRVESLLFSAQSGEVRLRAMRCGDLLRRHGRGLLLRSVEMVRRGARAGGKGQEEEEEEEGEWEGSRLALLTDLTVQNVVDVVARDGWEHVATTKGVVVHRQYIALGPDGTPRTTEEPAPAAVSAAAAAAGATSAEASAVAGGGSSESPEGTAAAAAEGARSGSNSCSSGTDKAPQFACVKATAIISVPPEVVYLLFADNSRVGEYNEHCREVKDLQVLSEDSKITWAASGRMGPFKARDFCTLVHFRTLSDGTLAQVSRPVEHPAAPRSSRYVRSEILLAGNFMRPVPGDPSRTEFLMVTHVNPGGAAETRAGAMLVNSLCASSPVTFIRRLEVAAQKLMLELQQQQQQRDRKGSFPAPAEDIGGGDGRCDGDSVKNKSDGTTTEDEGEGTAGMGLGTVDRREGGAEGREEEFIEGGDKEAAAAATAAAPSDAGLQSSFRETVAPRQLPVASAHPPPPQQ